MRVKILETTDYARSELKNGGLKIGVIYNCDTPIGLNVPFSYHVRGKNNEYYPFGPDEVEVIEN